MIPTPFSPSADAVRDAVAALVSLLERSGPVDARVRGDAAARLAELRRLWRQAPALFDPDSLARLRVIARSLQEGGGVAPTLAAAQRVLSDVFGYRSFRPGQAEIIQAVLAGRDCLGVMPTGAGKSLTYQIPARVLGGTTLVVSPLIALMKDQVDTVTEYGIRATFLNSSLSYDERRAREEALANGAYELVYAAPEGLEAQVGRVLQRARIRLIAVDEAHCISQWGHDFRPAYRNLVGLKRRFGGLPVLALTASAPPEVCRDIVQQLAMNDAVMFRGSFYRSNLRIHVHRKGDGADPVGKSILRIVRSRPGESGIVYCTSRKSTERTAEFLRAAGVRCLAYHAGLEPDVRASVQDAFRRDHVDVVVATVAFGMGIDKSNIRFVIHRDMPRSIESYYQEIGRAGRDGLASDCVLFYSWADVVTYDTMADEGDAATSARQRAQVREMFSLADQAGCRHQAVVRHLGERLAPCGGACDRCAGWNLLAGLPPAPRMKKGRAASGRTVEVDSQRPAARVDVHDADERLFVGLRELRKQIADEKRVPAYVVFSDATLRAMVSARPRTRDDLLGVSGVGPKKVASYGDRFLALLRESI